MQLDHIILPYRLTFQSAFHCGTGFRAGLVHRSIARDPHGLLYVPGSTLKGVLREHATRILALADLPIHSPHNTQTALMDFASPTDPVACIFGTRYRPGTLYFDDTTLCEEDQAFFRPPKEPGSSMHRDRFLTEQQQLRTRVSIARQSGTANRSMLFSSEYGRAGLGFDGTIYGHLPGVPTYGDEHTTYSLVLLLAALVSLVDIGGGRSSGTGRVTLDVTGLTLNGQQLADNPDQLQQTIHDYLAHLPELARDIYDLQCEIAEEGEEQP